MTEQVIFNPSTGDVMVTGTRCRRCGGNRLYADFTRELQCLDCDPPQKVFLEKFQAQRLKKLVQQAQVDKYQEEEREDERRRVHSAR